MSVGLVREPVGKPVFSGNLASLETVGVVSGMMPTIVKQNKQFELAVSVTNSIS
ncbi:MAG: hypothetical protein K2Y22_06005 [Candidatus Obscuribacterales bacterium]|nr:hypothetical protein [Candidatus Obscuribacterales bacterium]